MQSLHHLLTYAVHDIDHMLRYLLSIYLSSISIRLEIKPRGIEEMGGAGRSGRRRILCPHRCSGRCTGKAANESYIAH